MRQIILFIIIVYASSYLAYTQPILKPQVIATAGSSGSAGNYYLSYTIGQTVAFTGSTANTILTQGFHQPNNRIPYSPPDICIVLVDSALGKNKIIWEKPLSVGYIQSYKIYKETSTAGIYTNIGTLPFSQLTEFIDTSSNPNTHSDRYKLSFIDTCGIETNFSNSHKTLHLSVSPNGTGNGFQLIWVDQYEGFTFYTYNIYRRTNHTNFAKIDSIAFGNTSYTDTTNLHGKLYYFVSAVRPTPCSSYGLPKAVGGPYSQSISNIEDNGIADQGIDDINSDFKILKIYPNPFSDKTTIFIDNSDMRGYTLRIKDITGNIVKEVNNIKTNKIELYRNNLPCGFYIIELKGNYLYKGKVIIK